MPKPKEIRKRRSPSFARRTGFYSWSQADQANNRRSYPASASLAPLPSRSGKTLEESSNRMKVYEVLADAFAAEGMTALFGLMGDGNMYWLDAVRNRHPQIRRFEVRHEGPGLAMADGWARASAGIGVCTVT